MKSKTFVVKNFSIFENSVEIDLYWHSSVFPKNTNLKDNLIKNTSNCHLNMTNIPNDPQNTFVTMSNEENKGKFSDQIALCMNQASFVYSNYQNENCF